MGNVLVTISDKKKLATITPCDLYGIDGCAVYRYPEVQDYFGADVVTATDYYPFGMQMPGRKYSDGGSYRYGFNGKEKSNEVYGEGNVYDYGFRIYNPRLGKFLSTDPLITSYPWYTPYQFAGNKPIWAIDLDGLEEYLVSNYYDKDGRIEQTLITMINIKGGGRVNMKLQDDKEKYLAKDKVLIRDVKVNGRTTYKHASNLTPEQLSIVAKAKKELIAPKVSPFAVEGGNGMGKDPGKYYTTEREDYTIDKYEAVSYRRDYLFVEDEIKMGKNFARIYLNQESDVMQNSQGAKIYNGSIYEFSKELQALPDQLRQDKSIKSINIKLAWDAGPGVGGESLKVMERAIERTGQSIKNLLSASGVKNINVNTSVNITNKISNENALTIKIEH